MKRPDIETIVARVAAATPGPWEACESVVVIANRRRRFVCDTFCDAMGERNDRANEDAALIAAARTDVPALVDYVRHLEAELAKARRSPELETEEEWSERMDKMAGLMGM